MNIFVNECAGAKANLTCVGDANGKRSVVTVISNPTNSKGLYVIGVEATLPTGENLIHCKVSLNFSPLATCKVPTNVNNGIKGFGLNQVLRTANSKDKLFIVPKFYYTK